jgi:hypothetical protein
MHVFILIGLKLEQFTKTSSAKMIFFFKSLINRKEAEPEPQFIISAPALGGNLISAPNPQHSFEYQDLFPATPMIM